MAKNPYPKTSFRAYNNMLEQIDRIVQLKPNKYKNRSQFIKAAIMNLVRVERI